MSVNNGQHTKSGSRATVSGTTVYSMSLLPVWFRSSSVKSKNIISLFLIFYRGIYRKHPIYEILRNFLVLLAMLTADTALTMEQGCTNPGRQAAQATEVCKVVPNMCRWSVWNLCHSPFWLLELCDDQLISGKFLYP